MLRLCEGGGVLTEPELYADAKILEHRQYSLAAGIQLSTDNPTAATFFHGPPTKKRRGKQNRPESVGCTRECACGACVVRACVCVRARACVPLFVQSPRVLLRTHVTIPHSMMTVVMMLVCSLQKATNPSTCTDSAPTVQKSRYRYAHRTQHTANTAHSTQRQRQCKYIEYRRVRGRWWNG